MDQRSIAIVSYISILGWFFALVMYSANSTEKSSLARFHLRQSFGIFVIAFITYTGILILGQLFPFFLLLKTVVIIGASIFIVIGAINALNGEERLLPIIGEYAQQRFTFIS